MRIQVVLKNDQSSTSLATIGFLNYFANINGTYESLFNSLSQSVNNQLGFYDPHYSQFNAQLNNSVNAYIQVLLEEIMFFQGNSPSLTNSMIQSDPVIWEDMILTSYLGRV